MSWADERAEVMDALERLFDKGVVIDAWIRASAAGIDLLTHATRIVVTSIETYPSVPPPGAEPGV